MESKDLKIAAGSIITGSKISKPAKLQLLNFVQNEATDHQIMALMLDGKVVKIDEQAEQVVEDRFEIYKKESISEALQKVNIKLKEKGKEKTKI